MAINGNDHPRSPADKHALQAAGSMSELLALNKSGLMYAVRGVYTFKFIPSIPSASEPPLLWGEMRAPMSSLTSCWAMPVPGRSCRRGDGGDPATGAEHPPPQPHGTAAAGAVPLLPAAPDQRAQHPSATRIPLPVDREGAGVEAAGSGYPIY